jgi:uncharacterized membrane protein
VGGGKNSFAEKTAQMYLPIELFAQVNLEKTNEQISKVITCFMVLPVSHSFCAKVSVSNIEREYWKVCTQKHFCPYREVWV